MANVNWPLACVLIAVMLSVFVIPLTLWVMTWGERHRELRAEAPPREREPAMPSPREPVATAFVVPAPRARCPVEHCRIRVPHSHVEALIDKMRGGRG